MPTIKEIKAELKALKVKGITGKKKPELLEMLAKAKTPEAPATGGGGAPERIVMKRKKKTEKASSETPKQYIDRMYDEIMRVLDEGLSYTGKK